MINGTCLECGSSDMEEEALSEALTGNYICMSCNSIFSSVAFNQQKNFSFKEEIKKLNMTQKEFARNVGLHEDTVSKWARGVTETPHWVHRIVKLMGKEKAYNQAKLLFCKKIQQ